MGRTQMPGGFHSRHARVTSPGSKLGPMSLLMGTLGSGSA
jgi:hypothetical protein